MTKKKTIKSNIQKEFGKKVREKRAALGFSQEELAFKSGLHRTYIGSVERGERNISLENIVLLAKTLGVDPSVLLTTEEED